MKLIFAIVVACIISALFARQDGNTCRIWPDGNVPYFKTDMSPETVIPTKDDIVRFTNVSTPTITAVKALAKEPVPAVLICPGGGYSHLAWSHEGVETAQWFKNLGITAFILKYRCPGQRDAALADVQRALSFIRANAVNFNVNPAKLGIVGYSAGANLAVRVSTRHAKRHYAAIDDTDKVSCRPDWAMIVYPAGLIEKTEKENLSRIKLRDEYSVDSMTTPTFIIQSQDDFCNVRNAIAYYDALVVAGVEVEMHLFSKGGHGYGMREQGNPTDCWPALAEKWLLGIICNECRTSGQKKKVRKFSN